MTQAPRPIIALIGLAATAAWLFELWTAADMGHPLVRLMMPMGRVWHPAEAVAVWLMWVVMMAAMMLPSAMPMILAQARIAARTGRRQDSLAFILAYLVTLAAFSLAASLAQWGLQSLDVLTPMGRLTQPWLAGLVLVLGGLVQWSPVKQNCLSLCRAPIGFLATELRPGALGAFRAGLRHGVICLGCCWALMALLFVFGVMNLTAILLLTLAVAAEKLMPQGQVLSRIVGGVLVLWGLAIPLL